MSNLEKRVISDVVKFGFTYHADSMFKSYGQGQRTIARLVKQGLLTANPDPSEHDFHITPAGREFYKWEIAWKATP